MNPDQNPPNDPLQTVYNPLKVMQEGERVICEVKRHPVGLWGTYAVVVVLILLVSGGAAIAPNYLSSLSESNRAALLLGAFIISIIALLYAYVARIVYTGNRWIITTDSLTQVTQVGLFKKQSSQLSLANLEDVTVSQNGLFQSMVGFGTLKVETAGEHSKFTFPFCPNPNSCAKEIIAAHEAYIAQKPTEMQTSNRALANTQALNQSYAPPQAATVPPVPAAPLQPDASSPPQNPVPPPDDTQSPPQ